jgi:hypothetical protein
VKPKTWVDPEALAALAAEDVAPDEIVQWSRPVLAEHGGTGIETIGINLTALAQYRASAPQSDPAAEGPAGA